MRRAASVQMTKGAIAVVVAKVYPQPDERGRGKKSSATEHFPMVSSGKLSQARAVLPFADLADAVLAQATFQRPGAGPLSQSTLT